MDKIKIKAIIVSENTILDENKQLSLIKIFDMINANKFPALHPELHLVTIVEGEGAHKEKALIKDQDGNVLIESQWLDFNLEKNGRKNLRNIFKNLIFENAGEYRVEVFIDKLDKPVAEEKIKVSLGN